LVPRRRFIYATGGDRILDPPSETPKEALDPDEDDKLSGDMRELYDRLLPTQESIDRRAKLVEKLEKLLNREWPGKEIKVHVFGSSGNMLCSNDSDGRR
jgi:DNA polymerase sigma